MSKLKKGFTLIELIVVVAIIALLAGIVVGGITLARQSAIEAERKGNLKSMQTALEAYSQKNSNKYPNGVSIAAINTVLVNAGVLSSALNVNDADYLYLTNDTSPAGSAESSNYVLMACKFGNTAPPQATWTSPSWTGTVGCGDTASNAKVLMTITN